MGHSVLGYQFVAGLTDVLKSKLVGTEGSFDELLARARFEEAKVKEPIAARPTPTPCKWEHGTAPVMPTRTQSMPTSAETNNGRIPCSRSCFNCGLDGHLMKACPYPRQWKRSQESRGQRDPRVASMTSTRESLIRTDKQRVEGLRKELREAELAKAAGKTAATMHNVAAVGQGPEPKLGPTVFAELMVNGVPVQALIGTGSPATIISLDCAMRVLAQDGRKDRHLLSGKGRH